MAHMKPILALSSFGLGAALLLVAAQIQRDPFAFTSQKAQLEEALTQVNLVPPMEPATVDEIPVVPLEALPVLPQKPPAGKARKPVPANESSEPLLAPQPQCNPEWRELESGPVGMKVREICPAPTFDDVPRS
jgi:hypothetical protein